jgi:hypothetical protein
MGHDMKHEQRAVWYEPHPVTPERKAELMGLGYKILDAAFKPADADESKPAKRGRKPKD